MSTSGKVGIFSYQGVVVLLFAIAISSLLLLSQCRTISEKGAELVIASVWEASGQLASYGEAAQNAVDLSFSEFEDTRTPQDPKVKLIRQDTQSTSAGAAAAFRAILQQGNPLAVLGPLSSPAAMVLAPMVQESKVVLVTSASTPALTQAGPYVFRIYPSDSFEARELAQHIRKTAPQAGPFAVSFPQNEYGIGLDEAFSAAGGPDIKIVGHFAYPADLADFQSLAPKLIATGASSLYLPGYPATVGPLVRTLRDQGFKGQIYSSLGIEDASLFTLGGPAIDGLIYTTTAVPTATENPLRAEFERRFQKRFGYEATFPALYGYDIAQMVLTEVGRGATSSAKLLEVFKSGYSYSGVTGGFTFDDNGDVRRTYQIKKVSYHKRAFEQFVQKGGEVAH